MILSRSALAVLIALALVGCASKGQFAGECTKNSDCPTGSRCKITGGDQSGVCVCRSDEACAPDEVCNTQGICQKRPGCRSNTECTDATKFCDLASGRCIDRTACGQDVHCLPGTVCGSGGRCADGCFTTSDCPLFSVCDRTAATSTTALGTCIQGRCGDKSFCPYGHSCLDGRCAPAPSPWNCADCTPGDPNRCGGDATSYCLINPAYDPNRVAQNGGPNYCGLECMTQEDCPNGYDCSGVVLLTQDQCVSNQDCGGAGRQCVVNEGDPRGRCTCVNDQDCAIDQIPPFCVGSCGGFGVRLCLSDADCQASPCDLSRRVCQSPQGRSCAQDSDCEATPLCGPYGQGGQRVCLNSPNPNAPSPCGTSQDCLCLTGRCFATDRPCSNGAQCAPPCRGGGCVLGASCGPSQGLHCPDVRP